MKLLLALLACVVFAVWWKQSYLLYQWRWFTITRPYMRTQVRPYVLSREAERALKPGDSFRECAKDCPEMIVVPAGQFMMGSPDDETGRDNNEGPQHTVVLARPFAVSKFEVTFDDWDACAAHGDCNPYVSDGGWGRGKQPVISVSWDDAERFVKWLSRMTGKPYRLLSEAEWEYAARAGTATRYSFGDDPLMLGEYAWYRGNSGDRAHTVGEKKPNAFGLYDMHGNVAEWVKDCSHDNYDGAPTDGSAWTTAKCDDRVVRNASWYDGPQALRSAGREGDTTTNSVDNIGFRVARTLTARAGAITPDEH